LDHAVGRGRRNAERPPRVLERYYKQLLARLGPQGWWPARTRIEVVRGAPSRLRTRPDKMANWRPSGFARPACSTFSRLRRATRDELESCVPAGFFRQKALTIQNFLAWLDRHYAGRLRLCLPRLQPDSEVRFWSCAGSAQKPSTLFCSMQAAKPSLMLDAYTRRAPVRHHLVQEHASYSHVQEFLHRKLPPDPGLFNEYHAFCG